jgi:catecholate siderophore receptor
VHAQDLPGTGPARATADVQGSQSVFHFEIPAGTIDTVVQAFARMTGWTISVAKDEVRTVASPGVSGTFTADQALQKLLADTGLSYRLTSANSATLDLRGTAASVEVRENVEALTVSSPKFSQTPLETPQTISAVPQEMMQQQGTTTLRDALRNVAGISLAAGEGGAQGDNLTIRGFTARNDLFIDGMRDFGSYYRDPFNTQEVEVLQGPSSVTFGRGSTGGVVNQSTKMPGLRRFISGDLDFGTDQTKRAAIDIDQPLRSLGHGAAFRLNLMGDDGDVAGRDVARNRRFGAAPSLVLGLGSATRWTFSYFHQNADDIPDYGLPWLFNGPAPVPHNNYYGFSDGNFLRTYDDIGTVRFEHDVNSHISLRAQARYANYVRDAVITEAQTPASTTLATPLSAISVTRHEIGVNSKESYLDQQVDLTARLQTGPFRHDLVSGVEAGRETSDPTRANWTNVPTTSLLNPDPDQVFTGTRTITSIVHTSGVTTAAYILDTVHVGKHWDFMGGIRWDRFDTNYSQTVGAGIGVRAGG